MRDWLIDKVKRGLGRYGYELHRIEDGVASEVDANGALPPDFDEGAKAIVQRVAGYTMTSAERIFALREATKYVVAHDVPGSVVECGVWRGGSMMVVAHTLLELGVDDRDLYLFDTFEGMPEPTVHDVDYRGVSEYERWNRLRRNRFVPTVARASLRDVRDALRSVAYPEHRIHYVKGLVEDTVPAQAPAEIALLRLDTDYYESTRHEMFELYPRISRNGVLIIDDYGHFRGSEKAVNEFLSSTNEPLLLHRIDYSGRVAVKP